MVQYRFRMREDNIYLHEDLQTPQKEDEAGDLSDQPIAVKRRERERKREIICVRISCSEVLYKGLDSIVSGNI